MRINYSYIALLGIAVLCTCILVYQLTDGIQDEFNSKTANAKAVRNKYGRHSSAEAPMGIPQLVHHTWKRSVTPPAELVRWRKGCMKLNPEYEFRMYNDEDLLDFTKLHYYRYLPMFQHLHGVYMADMARVLVAYHYGGIYMDLDFYCHKPFRCLLKQVMQSLPTTSGNTSTVPTDLLVVPREALAHAVLFRNKPRVVIQDFYMATPKHPFLLWILEDRYQLFQQSIQPVSEHNGTHSGHSSVHANRSAPAFPKGPFSYSIEKDIDRYYAYKASISGNSGANKPDTDVIIELGEDILHPLVDATNSRLFSSCAGKSDTKHTPTRLGGAGPVASLPGVDLSTRTVQHNSVSMNSNVSHTSTGSAAAADSVKVLSQAEMKIIVCHDVNKRRYFQPSADTVMVHMWTHVYLGWSFIRGLYNAWTYFQVESALPPASTC